MSDDVVLVGGILNDFSTLGTTVSTEYQETSGDAQLLGLLSGLGDISTGPLLSDTVLRLQNLVTFVLVSTAKIGKLAVQERARAEIFLELRRGSQVREEFQFGKAMDFGVPHPLPVY